MSNFRDSRKYYDLTGQDESGELFDQLWSDFEELLDSFGEENVKELEEKIRL